MKQILTKGVQAFLMAILLMVTMTGQPALAQSRANLVVNGSFESGAGTGFGSSASSWSIRGGNSVVRVRAGYQGSRSPQQGSYFIAFNRAGTSASGVLSQAIQTVPGTRYDLSFYYSENGDNGAASSKVQLQVGNTVNQTLEAYNRSWQRFTTSFIANSTRTTLQFSDRSSGTLSSTDFNLDNVSIILSANQPNKPPTIVTPIPSQETTAGQPFSFTVPDGTFTDPEGSALTLSATLANGQPLPEWLTFDPATGEFSGTPTNADVGTLKIKVTATDAKGGRVSSNFDLVVKQRSYLLQSAKYDNYIASYPGGPGYEAGTYLVDQASAAAWTLAKVDPNDNTPIRYGDPVVIVNTETGEYLACTQDGDRAPVRPAPPPPSVEDQWTLINVADATSTEIVPVGAQVALQSHFGSYLSAEPTYPWAREKLEDAELWNLSGI